jgi:hypothetical protein
VRDPPSRALRALTVTELGAIVRRSPFILGHPLLLTSSIRLHAAQQTSLTDRRRWLNGTVWGRPQRFWSQMSKPSTMLALP